MNFIVKNESILKLENLIKQGFSNCDTLKCGVAISVPNCEIYNECRHVTW